MIFKETFRMYLACLSVDLAFFAVGMCAAWTSPIIPELHDMTEDAPFQLNDENEEGWISSLNPIGATVGSILAGRLADKFGRQRILFLNGFLFLTSFISFVIATSLWYLYFGRLVQGIASGVVCTVIPIYTSEITTYETRGPLASVISFFGIGGALYVYSLGALVTYRLIQIWCLVIVILFLLTFACMPETPYYYAMKKRRSDIRKSLEFLRGPNSDAIESETDEIQSEVDALTAEKGTLHDIFNHEHNRRALFICFGVGVSQVLSGYNIITCNAEAIFVRTESLLNPKIAPIVLSVVQIVIFVVNPFIIDRLGRKNALLISAIGMGWSFFILGTFFYLQSIGEEERVRWIPFPILILHRSMYATGFAYVPILLLSEVPATNIKGTVSSITSAMNWFLTFVVLRTFPNLAQYGFYIPFWLYAANCAAGFIFVFLYVIETKGLTLQQIQQKLKES